VLQSLSASSSSYGGSGSCRVRRRGGGGRSIGSPCGRLHSPNSLKRQPRKRCARYNLMSRCQAGPVEKRVVICRVRAASVATHPRCKYAPRLCLRGRLGHYASDHWTWFLTFFWLRLTEVTSYGVHFAGACGCGIAVYAD
jgi:hypothetical protein